MVLLFTIALPLHFSLLTSSSQTGVTPITASERFSQAATRSGLAKPHSFKRHILVLLTVSKIWKTVSNPLSLRYPLSGFTHTISVILDVFSPFPIWQSSGNPGVAAFSILLSSLKYAGRLSIVDSVRALSASVIFVITTHVVASCPTPILAANSAGPSAA